MSSSNPDLASVLRTLSAFANPASSNSSNAIPSAQQVQPVQPQTRTTEQQASTRTTTQPRPTISLPSQSSHSSSSKTTTDPSSITTWPTALKHIMHLVSKNQEFSVRIQHLIKSQRDHERQWWSGREALIEKQKTREEKKRRLEEVLKSVGVPTSTPSSTDNNSSSSNSKEVISADQEYATELKAYDSKVYHASLDMSRAIEMELRRFGVPFFCINSSLLGTDSTKAEPRAATATRSSSSSSASEKKTTKISKDELGELKKRVLDLLVDLCM